ncbi:hypothetical protein BJ138DRAFT_1142013 [Hygrophoropsis aurantiaca]|uniref:Uncharacterized protein n=1 Tax=Hygrophoropsis aurantiaca TaxID=72124 RepID=A0ACB8AQD9_9AGAM|nr:hypothetical protein BJ138DRAFT_1142013 [Hygrophoropsis aurantiaca]
MEHLPPNRKRARSVIDPPNDAGLSRSTSLIISSTQPFLPSTMSDTSQLASLHEQSTTSPLKKKRKRAVSNPPPNTFASLKRLSAAMTRSRGGRGTSSGLPGSQLIANSVLPSRTSARLASKNHLHIRNRPEVYHSLAPEYHGDQGPLSMTMNMSQPSLTSTVGVESSIPLPKAAKKGRGRPPKLNLDDPKVKAALIEEWARSRLSQGSFELRALQGDNTKEIQGAGSGTTRPLGDSEHDNATVSPFLSSSADTANKEATFSLRPSQSVPPDSPSPISTQQIEDNDGVIRDKASGTFGTIPGDNVPASVPPQLLESPMLRYPSLPAASPADIDAPLNEAQEDHESTCLHDQDLVLVEIRPISSTLEDISINSAHPLPLDLPQQPCQVEDVQNHGTSSPSPINPVTSPFLDSVSPCDQALDFQMLDISEAVNVPWIPLGSEGPSLYVPPGVLELISSMKFALELETKARRKAEASHLAETSKRIAAESTIKDLRARLQSTCAQSAPASMPHSGKTASTSATSLSGYEPEDSNSPFKPVQIPEMRSVTKSPNLQVNHKRLQNDSRIAC